VDSPNVLVRIKYYKPVSDSADKSNKLVAKSIKNRNFYTSNTSNNHDYLDYVTNGVMAGETYDYIEYAGNKEKSEGVFGKDGLLTDLDKKNLRKELRNTKSVVWDGLISFTEEYGKERLLSYKDAEAIVKKYLPKLLKDNHMDYENVNWFAGLHMNTDNRHIHLSFWEKEPTFVRRNKEELGYHNGPLSKASINRMKIQMEEELNGNDYHFDSYRRNITELAGKQLSLNKNDSNDLKLKRKLIELSRKLPAGRIAYNSLNMVDLVPLVDDITNLIIDSNSVLANEFKKLRDDLALKDREITNICKSQNVEPDDYLLRNKFLSDLYRRVGNKVIKYAKDYDYKMQLENKSEAAQRVERAKGKAERKKLLKRTLQLKRQCDYEATEVFDEYRRLLEKAEYDRLVESGEIKIE